jgi:4'-phosphopantetheinyl transferase EntD
MVAMIEELLPCDVSSASMRGDDAEGEPLAEELALVVRAVPSRQQEFISGRLCARRALSALGEKPGPILRGPQREPLWPQDIVGSITHCRGYRAAAVGRMIHVRAIGIDAELHDVVPAGVLKNISVGQERDWIASAPAGIHWDRVLFSAKESIYKAWFPLTGSPLQFDEALVRFDPIRRTFHAELHLHASEHAPRHAQCAPTAFDGRFMVRDGLVLTAVVLPAL